MYCNKCGAPIEDGNKFCPKCGNKVFNDEENKESIDDTTEVYDDAFKKAVNNKDEINLEKKDDVEKKVSNKKKPIKNNNSKNNINKNFAEGNEYKAPARKKKSEIFVVISVAVIIAIIAGAIVFRNNIKCAYYKNKYNKELDLNAKVDYAEKAFISLKNSSTKNMIKDSLSLLGEKDADSAEKKLDLIKDKLAMNEYRELTCSIKSGKINTLCENSKYEEALGEFEEMANLGEDIRKDKNYDDIMLNICADITGNSVEGSKNLLLEEDNVYYDNLDSNSNFDHIIEVKNNDSYSGYTVKVNLYAYKAGKYEHVDTKTFNKSYDGEFKGIYTCDKVDNQEKKAAYVYYSGNSSNSYCDAIAVIGVKDNKLVTIANVMGNEEVNCDDFNNDGIYEVFSKSTNDSGWFKVSWNGGAPKKIADENGGKAGSSSSTGKGSQTINVKTSDYIFSYSNTSYLSDYDLQDLDKNTLALARNEIFARHGYVFSEEPFVTYFKNKTWYNPNPNFKGDDSELNQYEIANYKKILEWEQK